MSIVTEVKDVEAAVETEAKAVETKVETVAEAVVTDVKKEETKVETAVKAAAVQIKAEEKLFLREAELDFVKLQMEIQRLQKMAEDKSKQYQSYVDGLFKTYVLDKAEYVFDGGVAIFKKIEKAL